MCIAQRVVAVFDTFSGVLDLCFLDLGLIGLLLYFGFETSSITSRVLGSLELAQYGLVSFFFLLDSGLWT